MKFLILSFLLLPFTNLFLTAQTQIVLLGTGTPNDDPERFGPSMAIVVNNTPYVIDCGPGVVRRATAAYKKGITGLEVSKLNRLFITHLHSDHTSGYPDFIFTPAVLERSEPLQVFGPDGIKAMTGHIMKAYEQDIDIRINGLEHGKQAAYEVNVTEVKPGVIYKDSNVTVKAFLVKHGSWKEAYGYRFETPDKVIVISGDCTFSESVIENAKGCDVLIHEVYSADGLTRRPAKWQKYHSQFHTSTTDVARIASVVKPKLLILTHQLMWDVPEESLIDEVRKGYDGKIISGHDLDIY
ncbi:MBL fold metallo-hydrolase [bacterium]|nr:MBL fold metallo-hydrolase [bacterium]